MGRRFKIIQYGEEFFAEAKESRIPLLGKLIEYMRRNDSFSAFFTVFVFSSLLIAQHYQVLTFAQFLLGVGLLTAFMFYVITNNAWLSLTVLTVFGMGYIAFGSNPTLNEYAGLALANINPITNAFYAEIPFQVYYRGIQVGFLGNDYWAIAMIFLVDAFIAIVAYEVPQYRYAARIGIKLFTLGYPVGWFLVVMVTKRLPAWAAPVLGYLVQYGAEIGTLWAALAVLFILLSMTAPVFIFIKTVTGDLWSREMMPVA